ncbi:MAG: ATP-binding cassette domain-containing protein [Planctomycetota bacterium]
MTLALEAVRYRYGRRDVLTDIHLQLVPGEIYGLVGPNGAGKTTLLRIALGLARPHAGRVLIDGIDPRAAATAFRRCRVGGVLESNGFHPRLSGSENLRVLARLGGSDRPSAHAEAARWFARVGLDDAPPSRVANYSYGMRQRLALAQACLGEPQYLMLDEPLNGLDPIGVRNAREILRELAARGVGILISSHQLTEFEALCTRIGFLRDGRLIGESTLSTACSASADVYRIVAVDPASCARALTALGLASTVIDAATRQVELGGQPAARVLRDLIAAGVEVLEFARHARSLADVYVETFSQQPPPPAPVPREFQASAPPTDLRATPTPATRLRRYGVGRSLRYELTRLWNRGALSIALALPVLASIWGVERLANQTRANAARVGEELFSTSGVTAFEAFAAGLEPALPILLLLSLWWGTQSIPVEASRGTLVAALLRPVTRTQFALGKFAAVASVVLGAYALTIASAMFAAAARFDFGNRVELLAGGGRYVLGTADELWPLFWSTIGCAAPPLIAATALAYAIGCACRSAMAAALGWGALASILLGSRVVFELPAAVGSWWLGSHLVTPLGGASFLRYYRDVAAGASDAFDAFSAYALPVSAVWMLPCLMAAVILLRRRNY